MSYCCGVYRPLISNNYEYKNNSSVKTIFENSYIGDVIFGRKLMDTTEIDNRKYRNSNLYRASSGDSGSSTCSQQSLKVGSHWQH